MILDYGLNEKQKQILDLKNEKIYYCVPFDIGSAGDLCGSGFTVVTEKRLFVISDDKILKEYSLSDLLEIKNENGISCGLLYAVPKKTGAAELVVRYSGKHLARYAYVAKGCRILISGGREAVVSEEYEKLCPKCGRALPGTRECPHCARKKEGLAHELFVLVKPYKWQLLLIFVLMLSASLVTLLNPEIQKHLIDDILTDPNGSMGRALLCLVGMFFLSMGIAVINVLKNYFCSRLGTIVSTDMRRRLYGKIQTLSLSFIDERKPGDLMNRVLRDTMRISDFMSGPFCNLFTVLIILISVVIYMLVLDWKLALLSFIFVPVSIGIAVFFRHNIHRRFHMQRKKEDKINSNLRDVLSGMSVVKSYGKEEEEASHFADTADSYAETQRKNETFFAILFPLMQFLMGVGVYLVTFSGGKSILSGDKTIGELMQFISYATMMYSYFGWLSNLPRHLMNLVTSVERISDVMNQEPKIADSPDAVDHKVEGDVEFKDVTFGYKTYEPVIEHVDLSVKKGEMIGLVGASGTGKSTMINLIMHLYDVNEGAILIDGIDLRKIKNSTYHSQIGVVLQETFLFSGTILNNIRFAKHDATTEEVIRAAKMANAHDFIMKLPDGYNTYVGEKGHNLSGGERQRIAIARAILIDPKILILDEATASLDTESEYLIQTALNRLTEGKTTFAIAHRLSTLKNADRLVVIDNHHIAEVGTHKELMDNKGIYYKLVMAQLEMQGSTREDVEV